MSSVSCCETLLWAVLRISNNNQTDREDETEGLEREGEIGEGGVNSV
jgi:hypothetical protein